MSRALVDLFDRYNELYFASQLERPRFVVEHPSRAEWEASIERTDIGSYVVRVSPDIISNPRRVEGAVLHEAIHLSVAHLWGWPSARGHSPEFREEAKRVAGMMGARAPTTREDLERWPNYAADDFAREAAWL